VEEQGPGKTILAEEEAIRLSESGLRVLFTCYNKILASEIRGKIGEHSSLYVHSFPELCVKLSGLLGLLKKDNPHIKNISPIIPDIIKNIDKIPEDQLYDAIVVDEGQDFTEDWWTLIDALLDREGVGKLRIYYDSNQNIYGDYLNLPDDIVKNSLHLTKNIRNTHQIYQLASYYYKNKKIPFDHAGPFGMPVIFKEVESLKESGVTSAECIKRLIAEEKFCSSNIILLTDSDTNLSEIVSNGFIGGILVRRYQDVHSKNTVVLDTISQFKGLEADVIILIVSPKITLDEEKELLYVGLTRARGLLIIISNNKTIRRIQEHD
jgi:Superfamily I DNA and RNA helicases